MEQRGERRARWVALVAALAVGVLTAGFLLQSGPGLQPLPPIAFSAETSIRQYDVAVAEDRAITQLTDDKLSYAPAWSPDGSQLAFVRARPGSFEECCGYAEARVWLMDADGANARPVGPWGIAPDVGPQWMPDGASVVYTVKTPDRGDREDAASLVELDIATGSETILVEDHPGYAFALSSDGTRIAKPTRRGITILTLGSGAEEVVAGGAVAKLEQLQWSPGDEWILGLGKAQGSESWGLRAWNVDEQRLVTVRAGSETIEDATWVAASQLVYCVTTETELPGDEVQLFDELWTALIGRGGDVDLRKETQYAADPPKGIPSVDDCIGEDMDALVVSP